MIEFEGKTLEQLITSAAEHQQRQQAEQAAHDALTEWERAALPYLRMTPAQFLEWKAKKANDGN